MALNPDNPNRLDARAMRFIDEFLADPKGCAKSAAERAGYPKRSARQRASELLKREDVQAEIAKRRAKAEEKSEATLEKVVRELGRIALFDPRTLFHADGRLKKPEEWSDDTAAAVASIEVVTKPGAKAGEVLNVHKVRTVPKTQALEALAKIWGAYTQRIEIDATIDIRSMTEDQILAEAAQKAALLQQAGIDIASLLARAANVNARAADGDGSDRASA